MDDILIYIPNDHKQEYHFCRLNLMVETFWTNQSKFSKSTQGF